MYANKLHMKESVLRKTLWGDYYLNSKTKRIHKGAINKGKRPLFVQFVLDNIWSVYDAVLLSQHRDKDKIKKITSALGLKMTPREFSHTDRSVQLSAIFTQWLPLANTVLRMVADHLPSPVDMTNDRAEKLMTGNNVSFSSLPPDTQRLKKDVLECNSSADSAIVVFVSKLFPIDTQLLPKNREKSLTREELSAMREAVKEKVLSKFSDENEETTSDTLPETETEATPTLQQPSVEFIGFARVFSGTVCKGQQINVLHPRYDPSHPSEDAYLQVRVEELYLLMGREVVEVDSVSAGNVCGIGGLGDHVLKCATLSSTLSCPALRSTHFAAAPIVHVAVEPYHLSDMSKLVSGMKLLNQADPCVEITVDESGQHILSTAGEVHLQRCIDDLKDTFAQVQLNVSEPIVPFRETVIPRPKVDMLNEAITSENEVKRVTNPLLSRGTEESSKLGATEDGIITVFTANKLCVLKIQATPLPESVVSLLIQNSHLLKLVSSHTSQLNEETRLKLLELKKSLEDEFLSDQVGAVDNIMAFGPRGFGPNILVNKVPGYNRPSVWHELDMPSKEVSTELREYDNSVVNGFQLATLAGPLCEEPVHGVCYWLLNWSMTDGQTDKSKQSNNSNSDDGVKSDQSVKSDDGMKSDQSVKSDVYGPFSGQLISAMKDGCRKAFLLQPSRLMAAMYSCGILATASILGQVYSVIGRRSGRVVNDEMIEGSEMFIINSLIPVAESFGFVEEIRKKTGGMAMPQLLFSHWEVLPSDPFWVPSTEEELAHFGDKADNESVARLYMNAIRRRKGLSVEEKLVEHAEKQRTLKKNK